MGEPGAGGDVGAASPSRPSGWPRAVEIVWPGAVTAVGAWGLAEASHNLTAGLGGDSGCWFPAGLAALLLRVPAAARPSVLVGLALGQAVHWWTGPGSLGLALLGAVLVVLEALLFAAIMIARDAVRLQRLRDVGAFALAAITSAVAVGLLAGAMWRWTVPDLPAGIAEVSQPIDSGVAFARYWAGAHLVGLSTLGLVILTWGRWPRLGTPVRWAQLCVASVALLMVSLSLAGVIPRIGLGIFAYPYVLVVLLGWLGLVFGPVPIAWGSVVVALTGVYGTSVIGARAFSPSSDPLRELASTQQFIVLCTLGILAVTVVVDERRRSLVELRDTVALVDSVLSNTAAVVFVKEYPRYPKAGDFGTYVLVNSQYRATVPSPDGEVLGKTDDLLHPRDVAEQYRDNDLRVLASGTTVTVEERGFSAAGEQRVFLTTKFPVPEPSGGRTFIGGVSTDITDLKRDQRRREEDADLLRAIFDRSPVAMVRVLDTGVGDDALIRDVNRAMCRMLGVTRESLVGTRPADLVSDLDRAALGELERDTQDSGEGTVQSREVGLRHSDGTVLRARASIAIIPLRDDAGSELVVSLEDVTAQRLAEAALTRQALYDELTGLFNRHALMNRLDVALARLRRHGSTLALLFIDLDGFKEVNDTVGHTAGDRLLADVARRLHSAVRPEDTLARLGGDEFVVLAEGLVDPSEGRLMAARLMAVVDVGWEFEGHVFVPTMSIGISSTNDPLTTGEDLLRQADLAMYRAKDQGRNRAETYEPHLERRAHASLAMRGELTRALEDDDLVVHFQPIVDLSTGCVASQEALVRLRSADGWLLGPSAFVDIAESSGLVVLLGSQVLTRSLESLVGWRRVGHQLGVSVNVSSKQLRHVGYARDVLAELAAHRLEPDLLTIEVLEESIVEATGQGIAELTALRDAGVHVAIDDFGTGYSSLSRLKALPADVIKIDRSFTRGLGTDRDDTAIVAAIIRVAHDLRLTVVAEGVETAAQAEELVRLGCQRAQGWLFGHPQPVDLVELGPMPVVGAAAAAAAALPTAPGAS